ncbi:ABC transporter substrate-binding protein [Alsobacter sp. R-9]
MTKLTRRGLLATGTGAAALALAGGRQSWAQAQKRVRMYWWGSKERADRTIKANQAYTAANASTAIDGETLGWGDYWPRMATQAAGRNLPDVIQMDYRYIFEYARRGALLPLDDQLGKLLQINDFGKDNIDCGRVDGKLYGINLGMNSSTVLYSKDAYAAAGLQPPTDKTTWKEFAALSAELTKAAKKDGFFGSADGGGVEPAFEGWLRMRGKDLYTPDEKLGFNADDATEWFAMWDEMRKAKACVPADVQALDKLSPESSMLTLGKAAVAFAHSNQLVAYQALTKEKLGMTMYPNVGPGSKLGHYMKPSMFWSVASTTKNPEDAAKIVNFYVTATDGAKAIGVERGVPASAATRKAISPDLDELGKAMVDYISFISDKVGALPPPPPKGAGEIQFVLKRINEEVGFGKTKVADAGKAMVTESASILARG